MLQKIKFVYTKIVLVITKSSSRDSIDSSMSELCGFTYDAIITMSIIGYDLVQPVMSTW